MNRIVLIVLCLFLVFLIRGLRARKRGEMVYNEVVAKLKEKTRVALGLDDYEDFRPIPFFSDGGEYVIPFGCVKKIGPDIILVEIHEKKQPTL